MFLLSYSDFMYHFSILAINDAFQLLEIDFIVSLFFKQVNIPLNYQLFYFAFFII